MKKLIMAVAGCLALAAGMAHAEVSFKGEAAKVDEASGTLVVAGMTIDAKNAVVKDPLQRRIKLSEIPVGQRVDVDGEFSADGGFVARVVEKDFGKQDEFKAGIDAVDAAARSYKIGSVVIVAGPGAEIEVKDDEFGAFDTRAIGMKIEAEGRWSGDKQLTATKVKVE